MNQKKRVAVLVVVAVVLAIIAISMSLSGSDEVQTKINANVVKQPTDGGKVGIVILGNTEVEDKLAGGNNP